jgi:hypothetical protein
MNHRFASWVFTHNNYDKVALDAWDAFACSNNVRYLIFGEEVGKSGTQHLQEFFQLVMSRQKKVLLEILRKMMKFSEQPEVFIEEAKNDEDAKRYCQKDENWIEW